MKQNTIINAVITSIISQIVVLILSAITLAYFRNIPIGLTLLIIDLIIVAITYNLTRIYDKREISDYNNKTEKTIRQHLESLPTDTEKIEL